MAQGRSTKVISMIKWIRTSRLSIKNSFAVPWRLLAFRATPSPAVQRFHLTECITQIDSKLPRKIVNLLFTVTNLKRRVHGWLSEII